MVSLSLAAGRGRRYSDGAIAERQGYGRCIEVGEDRVMPRGLVDAESRVGFVDHLAGGGGQGVQFGAFLLGLLSVPRTWSSSVSGRTGRPSSLRALWYRSQS